MDSTRKIALFAYNGDTLCFVHVLLNALDMNARGWEARIVVEGQVTRAIPALAREGEPFHDLFTRAKMLGLIAGACKACSAKMGVIEEVRAAGIPLLDDMQGHPSIARFLEQGYEIMTF